MNYTLYYKAIHTKEISECSEMYKEVKQSTKLSSNPLLNAENIWHVRIPVVKLIIIIIKLKCF